MKGAASLAWSLAGAIFIVVLTYIMLRPAGLQRTVELFQNFFSR